MDHPEDPDARFINGFTVLGGYGFEAPAGQRCTLAFNRDWLTVVPAWGFQWRTLMPMKAIIDAQIDGPGMIQQGGGFIGGGFGLQGIVLGMAAASVLNSLTTSQSIITLLRLNTADGELILHNGVLIPEALRNRMSPLFGRLAARAASAHAPPAEDPTIRLQRLVTLRDSGALTPDEYEAARIKIVNELT